MAFGQTVQVVAQWTDGAIFASGNFQFVASGVLMESAAVAIVTPFIQGQLDSQGSLSVLNINSPVSLQNSNAAPNSGIPLLASDNFSPGELTWNVKIQVQGITDIFVPDFPVNFALGATQGLFGILQAAGWQPTPT